MNCFDYTRKPTTVTVFGKNYEIPTKTAYFVDECNTIIKKLAKAENAVQAAEITLSGIGLFLGDEFVSEHYDRSNLTDIDTDEIGALWMFLRNASDTATAEVLKKYAPVPLSE